MTKKKSRTKVLALLLVGAVLLSACYGATASHSYTMADHGQLSNAVRQTDPYTQDGYRFAVANPEILAQFPCYCGCGYLGHTNNLDCYVSSIGEGRDIVFDEHALNCSICVDITHDVMSYLDQGIPLEQMQQMIDDTYSRLGPSNMTSGT